MKNLVLAALILPFPAFAHVTDKPHAETLQHILSTVYAHPLKTILVLVAAVGIGYVIHRIFKGR